VTASVAVAVPVPAPVPAAAAPRLGLLAPRPGLSREVSFQEPGLFGGASGCASGCALATASTARFASRSKVRKESAWSG